jgi:ATP-dependent helicase HrpA
LKVQRLPIEPISQASADQRKGRCGRVAEGVCIRLYAEEDFAGRPRFTDPEILRTNLASVILQMTALGLGDLAAFPFVDPPDRRSVRDGVQLLEELGALDPQEPDPRKRLTPLGRRLAALPVDPRLGRMVLEAERNGCVQEVLVIAAGLSIQDPRERPAEHQQAADDMHRRFADERSDFLAYLNLWNHLQEQQRALSSSAFRRACKAEFLHYLRVREWQDLVGQLRQVVRGLGIALTSAPDDADRVHQSLLAGLLSHIGLWDAEKRDYAGARGARFAAWPGSALFRKPPRWVMAGELVETSRLWGRDLARIEPEWAETLAGDLAKRSYSEPHWEARRGAVVALEKVTLYGVPIVAGRKVGYAKVDPQLCRELFIRHALVEGDWRTHHRFFHDNRALLEEVEDLEHRARRRDIVVDDESLFEFYDRRIPPEVVSARHFDAWWKKARRDEPDLLSFERSMLLTAEAERVSAQDYPDQWRQDDLALRLTYQFEPGAAADGVTVHVPLPVLNRVRSEGFDWQVPGLRADLATALIRSLPKAVRRGLAPAPDRARAALARIDPSQGPLLDVLAAELRRSTGVTVPAGAWDLGRVPDHLRMTFRVVDDAGRTVAEGKDLEALRARLVAPVRTAIAQAAEGVERTGLREWSVGALPRVLERTSGGHRVTGYPALVDEGDSVAVRLLASEAEQTGAMWAGTRRLLLLSLPSPVKAVLGGLGNRTKLALSHSPHGSPVALFDDCIACAVDALMAEHGGPAWDAEAFAKLRDAVRGELVPAVTEVVLTVAEVLAAAEALRARLAALKNPAVQPSVADMRAQLDGLVHAGFVTETGRSRLGELPRYLHAVGRRLDTLGDVARDQARMRRVAVVRAAYDELLAGLSPAQASTEPVRAIRWMLEELRVSLFAQTLGTAHPVSEQRILRAVDDVRQAW